MSRESLIESEPWTSGAALTGTFTTAVGSANLVGVATLFLAELNVNDIVFWTDDNGLVRSGQVASITNDLLATLHNNCVSVATAVGGRVLNAAAQTVSFFRSDNTVQNVPIIQQSSFGVSGLKAYSRGKIDVNEGITIKSLYVRLPYQYTMADGVYVLDLYYGDSAGVSGGPILSIGEGLGKIHINIENIEVPVNTYVLPLTTSAGGWQVMAQFSEGLADLGVTPNPYGHIPRVSCVDAPDDLNGVILPVFIGARIEHAATSLIV